MISTAEHDSTMTYALFCSNKGKSFFKGSGFYPTTASHTDPCFPPGDFYLCICPAFPYAGNNLTCLIFNI